MTMLQLVNGEHLPELGVETWTLRGDTATESVSAALKAGFTGKWIFLPASGCWEQTALESLGDGGTYWCSPVSEIPHGNAIALCMIPVLEWLKPYCIAKYADMSRMCGFKRIGKRRLF